MTEFQKHLRHLAAIILLLVLSSDVSAQAEAGILDRITEKFVNHCRDYPWEEIFIHTDREDYIAGEDLWFKAYLIDRQSNKPKPESSIAYFEILNYDNRPVAQLRIRLEHGFGPGEIQLSDTLSSGEYMIRAYTNRMKNFFPANCFMKKITVYNALGGNRFKTISKLTTSAAEPAGLEEVIEPGLKININRSGTDGYFIDLETDNDFRAENKNICHLLIRNRGRISFKSTVSLTADQTRTILPPGRLLHGINQAVIFDGSGMPVAEKYFFVPAVKSGNTSVSAPENIGKREKIIIEIELDSELLSGPGSPELSISVAETGGGFSPDIEDYLIFGSEFGYIPEEFLEPDPGAIPDEKMDRLLSDLKSNWIDWKSILSGSAPVLDHPREKEFHYLRGRLISRNGTVTGANKFVLLSIPGKKASFRYATTDEQGYFSFILPVDMEPGNLIIQPEIVNTDLSIRMETSFSEIYPRTISMSGAPDEIYLKYITRQGANYQVKKIYGSDDAGKIPAAAPLPGNRIRFYGKPDQELVMDDYIKLPVMQEVFFELMPGISLRKRREEYEITVTDPVEIKTYEKPPVLFIDGVVIHDAAIIADLDPEFVEQIDAVRERYVVGEYLFYGLINVITRAGDFSNVELPEYAVRMPYRITAPVNSFISPEYPDVLSKENRLPDLRNTLYWNPSVRPDAGGKARIEFWSSDYATGYVVNIRGITADGKTMILKKNIKIKVG